MKPKILKKHIADFHKSIEKSKEEKIKKIIKILKENSSLCIIGPIIGPIDEAKTKVLSFNSIDKSFHIVDIALLESEVASEDEIIPFIRKSLKIL